MSRNTIADLNNALYACIVCHAWHDPKKQPRVSPAGAGGVPPELRCGGVDGSQKKRPFCLRLRGRHEGGWIAVMVITVKTMIIIMVAAIVTVLIMVKCW